MGTTHFWTHDWIPIDHVVYNDVVALVENFSLTLLNLNNHEDVEDLTNDKPEVDKSKRRITLSAAAKRVTDTSSLPLPSSPSHGLLFRRHRLFDVVVAAISKQPHKPEWLFGVN
ncbi:hypothetical protein ACFE04_002620 [Oxalis oulophora]